MERSERVDTAGLIALSTFLSLNSTDDDDNDDDEDEEEEKEKNKTSNLSANLQK